MEKRKLKKKRFLIWSAVAFFLITITSSASANLLTNPNDVWADTEPIPEPTSLLMLGFGLFGLGVFSKKIRQKGGEIKMGKLLMAGLIITFFFGVQSAAQANLLTNPGFETGTLAGWTAEYNPENQFISTANPQQGTYHLRNSNDGAMYQDVGIAGDQQYRLTGYAYIPSGGQVEPWNTFIGLRMFDSVGTQVFDWQYDMKDLTRNQYNLADSTWVAAPSGAVTARVRLGTWADSPWQPANPTDFDSFDLSPIPEPASLLMLGFGLLGLGVFKKRRI